MNPKVGDRVRVRVVQSADYASDAVGVISGKGRNKGRPIVYYDDVNGASCWTYLVDLLEVNGEAVEFVWGLGLRRIVRKPSPGDPSCPSTDSS